MTITALLSAALQSPARAERPSGRDPGVCVPPSGTPADGPVRVSLVWSNRPVTPGTAPTLGVTVTNTGTVPTADPTLVVVHLPTPDSLTAPPGADLSLFGTGGSYRIPAGLPAGAGVTTTLTLDIHAEAPPNATQHCDVTSFTGGRHSTVGYDLVTGDPVVHLTVGTYGPLSAAPGSTLDFGVVEHNAGPSNAHTGETLVTMTAPWHTHWVAPLPYRCRADAASVTLSCSYPGAPLVWRDEAQWPNLALDPDVEPGTVLSDGELAIANPWDCAGETHRTPFSVTATTPTRPTPSRAPAPAHLNAAR